MSGIEMKVDDLGRRKYVGVTYLEIFLQPSLGLQSLR